MEVCRLEVVAVVRAWVINYAYREFQSFKSPSR